MGDTNMKDGYDRVEGALMRGSNTIKELYPDLYCIIKKYASVNDDNYIQLQPLDKNTASLLHRENGDLTRTINNIKSEWKMIKNPDGEYFEKDPKKSGHCELCGHPRLLRIFRIRNISTGIILKVGSTCIDTYNICIENLTVEESKIKLKDINSTEHMSKRNQEMNQKTNRGKERYDAANRRWTALPYLPSYELTLEIQKYQDRLQSILKRFRVSKEDMSNEDAHIFRTSIVQLETALGKAETLGRTAKENWPVSQKVYQWAQMDDKKPDNKNRNQLATALEKAGRIDSTTVQRIMEEDHVNHCIAQLQQSSLCDQFTIEDTLSDSLKVKIHVLIDRKSYPFSIYYKFLIDEAAKLGFPDKVCQDDRLIIRDLLHKWRTPLDLNSSDAKDAWSLVYEMCTLAGIKIEDRNDDDTITLLRVWNNQGTTIDTSLLVSPVTSFLIYGNKNACIDVLHSAVSKQKLESFDIARINWNAIHR